MTDNEKFYAKIERHNKGFRAEAEEAKEKFYAKAETYFAEGLFREIYSSELLCICNIANGFYAIFPIFLYMGATESTDGIFGIEVDNTKYLSRVMKGDRYFAETLPDTPEELNKLFNKSGLLFDDSNIDYLWALKAQTDANGPDYPIDLQFEESIRNGRTDLRPETKDGATDMQPEGNATFPLGLKLFLALVGFILLSVLMSSVQTESGRGTLFFIAALGFLLFLVLKLRQT